MKITITSLGVLAAAAAAQAVDFTTLDGKVLLGCQGWFNYPGDGATYRGWRSWARDTPSAKTLTVDMYPDLSEFNPSDLCPIPGFTVRGRQAFLYSAMNSNVVDRHFLWMKDYGLTGVLIQRFFTGIPVRRAGGDVVPAPRTSSKLCATTGNASSPN